MKKVLYISRHPFAAGQIVYIESKLGTDVQVDRVSMSVHDVGEVARMYKEGGYDELIVVLPLGIVQGLCAYGLKPIRVHGQNVNGTWIHGHFEKVGDMIVKSEVW